MATDLKFWTQRVKIAFCIETNIAGKLYGYITALFQYNYTSSQFVLLPDCMWTVSVLSPGPHPMSSESVSDQTVSSVSMTTGPESWLKVSAIAQHLSLTAL